MKINLKKNVNSYKTRFFKLLTSSFKNSKNINQLSKIDIKQIRRILVTRPNHRLGNQLLLSPLLQTIENEFPYSKIDLLVNGSLSEIIFENYRSIQNIYLLPKKPFKHLPEYIKTSYKVISSKYDIAIVGNDNSNSSKIFTRLSRATFKIFSPEKNAKVSIHIAKKPIDILTSIRYKEKYITDYPKLDIKLTDKEIQNGNKIISSLFPENKNIIAIFTNATGNKKHSKQWWNQFCSKLEYRMPNVNILEILPKENISQVDFQYKSYLSTDIREMASIIENCSIFIGADSGVMHLATTTNTATFGLFNGNTKPEIYGPYGNHKYFIETNRNSVEELITKIENTFYNNGYK